MKPNPDNLHYPLPCHLTSTIPSVPHFLFVFITLIQTQGVAFSGSDMAEFIIALSFATGSLPLMDFKKPASALTVCTAYLMTASIQAVFLSFCWVCV